MKIEINLNNVITSKDQITVGMHIWQVGQGGTSGVQKPYYVGRVLGFGGADYTWEEGSDAQGFIIQQSQEMGNEKYEDIFLAILRPYGGRKVRGSLTPEEMEQFELLPAYVEGEEYSLADVGGLCVASETYLPQSYNNWYSCDSEEKAQAVYEEMKAKWTEEHEAARVSYEEQCRSWDDYDYVD